MNVSKLKKIEKKEREARLRKQKKTDILIKSDGTPKGTKFFLNGKEVKNLKRMSFNLNDWGSPSKPTVSCNYAQTEEKEDGFVRTQDYNLDLNTGDAKSAVPIA